MLTTTRALRSRILLRIALTIAVVSSRSAALAAPPAPPFEHEASDLKPDPAARFGTLGNGLRYVVYPNHEPKGRASLRLLVLAGSLQENDGQRGLAHFLEHMAFKGSAHYAPGTLVERLQRMGMRFGADTNASTSFDRTLFLLELPDTNAVTLQDGCQIFADYAGGLFLQTDQINAERGVILSEKRDRDSIGFRTQIAEMKFALPATIIPERMPIGLAEVIEQAPRERFVEFYNAWYRPENIAVIAVGDFDPGAVEAMIKATFAGLTARAPAPPESNLGNVVSPLGLSIGFHSESEAPATTVQVSTVMPYQHEIDNSATRLRHLKRDLAFEILNQRLQILSRKEDAPFTGAYANAEEEWNFLREASINVMCKPQNWPKAVAVAEQELRRALTHGFAPAELAEIVARMKTGLDQAVQGSSTQRSERLAGALADTIVARRAFTSPAENAALFGPALDKMTPQDCLDALRQAWAGPGRDVFVSGNLALDHPEKEIGDAYRASAATAVEPPAAFTPLVWPYTDFGASGTVASSKDIADLGITEVIFANGVRLNLKKTDFEAHRVSVSVRVGGGLLTASEVTKPGLAALASQAFSLGGLGKLSVDELSRVLAGKPVGAGFQVGIDAFTFNGVTDSDHLPLEFQLLAAWMTDAGYRSEALWIARKNIPPFYNRLEHSPEGVLQTRIDRLLASGDPRFGLPAQADLMARNLGEIKAWLSPQLAVGPMEIAIVGDFDPKVAIDAVAKTLGALPARAPKPDYAAERKVALPKNPSEQDFTVETKIPKGLLLIVWPATDARDAAVARRLGMLASILSDRLRIKIRNEMSGAYSPQAGFNGGTIYPGYGWIESRITVDPPAAGKIVQAVLAIAADLQKNGVTADELDRAKNPTLASVKESMRTNRYWLSSVLFDAQEEPQRLDWARTRLDDVSRITKADVDALAAQYLDPSRAFRFVVLPSETR